MGEGRGARDKKELSGVSPSLWTSLPLPSEHWVALSVSVLYHDHSALKILILLGWWFKMSLWLFIGEGNGTPLQYSCLENPMDGGAWKAAVHGVAEGRTRLNDFTFTFHFHVLEKEMATHFSVLAWRIPGTGEPGGLPSVGSHRVRHDWSNLAAAAAVVNFMLYEFLFNRLYWKVSSKWLHHLNFYQRWMIIPVVLYPRQHSMLSVFCFFNCSKIPTANFTILTMFIYLFFFQFYWDIVDIQRCISLSYIA